MKIAIDSGPLTGGHSVRGIGFYTKNLVSELGDKVEVVDFSTSTDEKLSQYDVLHYPYFDLFFNSLRIVGGVKTVVTIHDVIPLIYPKHYPAGIKGKINFEKQKRLLKKVDKVITDSETSKKDIVRFLDYPAEKIEVIYLAAGKQYGKVANKKRLDATRKKLGLEKKFVLYVGDVNYNKNVEALVNACINLKLQLVIVGKHAIEIESIIKRDSGGIRDKIRKIQKRVHPQVEHLIKLKGLVENKYIRRLGFVDDQDLVDLYNLASVYVFPSLYEGFGLSPLEAMACGCPVIINKTQTLVEVSGKGSMVVDASSVKELSEAIEKVVNNKEISDDLIVKGKNLIKNYDWKKTTIETMDVYKSL